MKLGRTLDTDADSFVKPLRQPKKNKNGIVFEIDFDTTKNKIGFIAKSPGNNSERIAKEYLWVGNEPASAEQWFATTDQLNYVLSGFFCNILKRVEKGSQLEVAIEKVQDMFFLSRRDPGAKNRQGRIMNLKLCDDPEIMVENFIDLPGKDLSKEIEKRISGPSGDILLWSVSIDGTLISKNNEYKVLVAKRKLGGDENYEGFDGYCSVCGEWKKVSFESTKQLRFKYFITDKQSFASDTSKGGFFRNMAICNSCLSSQLLAESHIRTKLTTKVGDYTVYIFPEFLGLMPGREEIDSWTEYVNNDFNTMLNYESLAKLEDRLNKQVKGNSPKYVLTLLFQKSSGGASSEFKIDKLVQEVPETRLKTILSSILKICLNLTSVLYGYNPQSEIRLTLRNIFRITHSYGKNDGMMGSEVAISVIQSIIEGVPVKRSLLLRLMSEHLRGMYNDAGGTTWSFVNTVFQMTALLMFIGQESGVGNNMNEEEPVTKDIIETIPAGNPARESIERMNGFISATNYSAAHRGLLWLGYICADLGRSQYFSLGKSPIFDKINFKGMNRERLIRFTDELYASLKHYNILGYRNIQVAHFLSRKFLDPYLEGKWEMSEYEVPFYLMSGISAYNALNWTKSTGKGDDMDE